MERRTMVRGFLAAGAASASGLSLAGPANAVETPNSTAAGGRSAVDDSLVFDDEDFTLLTETLATPAGERQVTYRFYRAVTYVARPVEATYQCLNVSAPVEIDGAAVDPSRAAILLSNGIGGYLSSSVADATGVGGGGPSGPPGGGADDEEPPSNARLALAAGHVVIEPGARGRELTDASGRYYGVAPAALVDLKAAVRYIRFNEGRIPGDTHRIVSCGTSAGGALSALLGATGDSPAYHRDLAALGAAEASDAPFASAAYCPITDLEHADMAYEWNWGENELADGGAVDPAVSAELRSAFDAYQRSLGLRVPEGRLTTRTYGDHLVRTYLRPAAERYLTALSDSDRATYLAQNPWLTWRGGRSDFTFADYLAHVGARKKDAPAFDPFDLSSPENNLYGHHTTEARHFTRYSLRHATGDDTAELDRDLPRTLHLMNPMPFLAEGNPSRARHWFLRVGTKDTDTSLTVLGNLAAAAHDLGDEVDAAMYWDAPHAANEDPEYFVEWLGRVTGRD